MGILPEGRSRASTIRMTLFEPAQVTGAPEAAIQSQPRSSQEALNHAAKFLTASRVAAKALPQQAMLCADNFCDRGAAERRAAEAGSSQPLNIDYYSSVNSFASETPINWRCGPRGTSRRRRLTAPRRWAETERTVLRGAISQPDPMAPRCNNALDWRTGRYRDSTVRKPSFTTWCLSRP